jgi:putative transposase
MIDESTRNAIALKKFSLISPVINGQTKSNLAYYTEITSKPIEMPCYGMKNYAPKTLESWYCAYMKGGIDALKPSVRADKGGYRKIKLEIEDKIIEMKKLYPKAPDTVVYDMLIKTGAFTYDELSISTLYRFLKSLEKKGILNEEPSKEIKRFSHIYVNELWQTDLMYGPYITVGKKKMATYLLAYIDDASRLISHAQFYFAQNFEALRHSFKEAVLKRGIPELLYTDNGKIYRSQQFAYMCASIGCTVIHTKPFSPNEKGKIERFFGTVRRRFLTEHNPADFRSLEDLNDKFYKWLDEDYHRKPHSGLNGITPLDKFMEQSSRIKLMSNTSKLNEQFLLRINRKVIHDATFTINNILFETDVKFANSKVEIRYDPEWLVQPNTNVLIFLDDKKIGEAHQVNYADNAKMKRRGRPTATGEALDANAFVDTSAFINERNELKQTISFLDIMKGANDNV